VKQNGPCLHRLILIDVNEVQLIYIREK
jgi:hypothetical protein